MPLNQSLISIYLMCSFCSFIVTPWFGKIPNNIYIYIYYFMPSVKFCGKEEERGSEKEINKKVNSIWLMEKK